MIARPRWAGALFVTLLITAVPGMALMATEVGRQGLVDQWERTAIAFGRPVDDQTYAGFERMSENGVAYAALSAVASGPILALVTAAFIFAVSNRVSGTKATYTQVLALTTHAGVILALRQLVAAPLNYMWETLASPTRLSLFFPMLDEASPAARFFGVIDVFVIWWLIVLAVGVSLLYRRPLRSVGMTFVGAYVGFAALLAIAMAVTGGTA